MNDAKIYLCKSDCSILGSIGGIKTETCSLTRNATDLWEITFEVDRYVESSGKLVQSNFYDSIDDMMRIYLDSDGIQAFFVIDSEPTVKGEGLQEVKTVTAHSIECELSNMYLQNLKVNCGTPDSQEYLVTDENNNSVNLYKGLPISYVDLVNYDESQLSIMHLALQNTGWSVKEDIPKEICTLRGSFESSDSVYSFLMKTVSPALSIIFEFDRKNKQIGIVKVDDFGKDTGVFVTMRNLINSFEVTSSSEDTIMTKIVPTGVNNLGIEQVNFGKDYIVNLDYFMNTLNEYGDYKYVSAELHDKYNKWKNYRDNEKVVYIDEEGNEYEYTRRELFAQLTRLYNKAESTVSELINRVPNDGCVIDYKTFSLEELKQSLTAYENALDALLTCYKNDIIMDYELDRNTTIIINDDFSLTITPQPSEPISPTLLPNTDYWYDYYAYKEKIIPQVIESLKMYCETNTDGSLKTDGDGHYIELEYGNAAYYADETILKSIDSYLYEWSLYGLDELEAKKKVWGECANVLFNECFIASGTISNPVYRTADENGWIGIGNKQSEFTSKDAYINQLNQFLDYMSFDETRENSLTGKIGKGIIRQCEDAIADRNKEISKAKEMQETYNNLRGKIANSVVLENFKVDDTLLFTDKDLSIIQSMLKTKNYSNEYILTTNLDDTISTVDKQEELYQDALIELDKISQPQYSFKTELDNLYSLEEFKAYRETFDVGNFIRVGLEIHEDLYDNNYVKLRLMSITHNPLEISEDLSVEFSTMTKSLNTISDLAFLLDSQTSFGSSSSSSSSSSGGTYGNNDASVQMSNTMLNALLKTEMFGTAVNDVILDTMKANKGNFNTLFSHSGVFDSLETGQIKVSGDCLFDRIKSRNWNGTESNLFSNTEGSILDLSNGKFNFAGGKLKWNGTTLSVDGNGKFTGDIVANSLTLGSNATVDGLSSSDLDDANKIILKDLGIGSQNSNHSSNYIKVSSNGLLEADNAIIHGTVYATDGKFAGTLEGCDGSFTGSINVNNKFIVDANGNVKADGTLVASNADISGNITATTLTANQSGSIAGWTFNSNAFYKNDSNIGSKNGFYIGEDGISIGDYFVVNSDGVYCKNKDLVKLIYNNNIKFSDIMNKDGHVFGFVITNIENYIGQELKITFKGKKPVEEGTRYVDVSYVENVPLTNGYDYYSYLIYGTAIKVVIDEDIAYIIFNNDYIYYAISNNNATDYDKISITSATITNSNDEKIVGIVYCEKVYKDGTSEFTYSTILSRSQGLQIVSEDNLISSSKYDLGDNLKLYDDFSIQIRETYNEDSRDIFRLNKSEIYHNGLTTSSTGDNLVISGGNFYQKSSSSQRYKNSIQSIDTARSLSLLSPSNLYDIDVVTFKYNDDYLPETDQRYQQDIPGFIAEDVYEKYPIACNLDSEGRPEMWDINIMFPAALALIQEQHEDIESLKEEVNILKETINNSEVS